MPSNVPRYLLEFTKADIEAGKLPEFIENTADLLAQPDLADFHGMVHFTVGGYDSDPREITEISEVRAFYTKFRESWPYWLFFVDVESLKMMLFCTLRKYTCVHDDKKTIITHIFDDDEIKEFIREQTPKFREVCQKAGLALAESQTLLARVTNQLLVREARAKPIRLTKHAQGYLASRGFTEAEVQDAIRTCPWLPSELGRQECRKDFPYRRQWNGKDYAMKQVRPIFIVEETEIVVITVYTYYF